MNAKQKKRCIGIVCLILMISAAAGLVLYALKQNINLFYTPTELAGAEITPEQTIRVGGYVKSHSVHYDASGQGVRFIITDNQRDTSVNYHGVLPSLFREGQGIVVTGKLINAHSLLADQVLAKHDEKYMPSILKKELDKRGNYAT